MFEKRHKKIEIQTNETQDEQERDEFKTPEGTRRKGPPFPINSLTKSQESMAQILERTGREPRGREGAWDEGEWLCSGAGKEQERERGKRGYLTLTTLNPKD